MNSNDYLSVRLSRFRVRSVTFLRQGGEHAIYDVFCGVIVQNCGRRHIAAYVQLDDIISIRSAFI